jgi:S1-C subfamily serine protease
MDRTEIMGSGVVVGARREGAYILTAAHVCESSDMLSLPFVKDYRIIIEVVDLNEEKYLSEIISMNSFLDTCILFARKLRNKVAKISLRSPRIGTRVYNVAAPANIFYKDTVPILEGFFNGNVEEREVAMYSIPATGGSSGSPIFNSHGYLIGMIHSVNVYFPVISISPTHKDLRHFISSSIRDDIQKNKSLSLPQQ